MAVAVEQHGRGARFQVEPKAAALPLLLDVVLEQHAGVRDAAPPARLLTS